MFELIIHMVNKITKSKTNNEFQESFHAKDFIQKKTTILPWLKFFF